MKTLIVEEYLSKSVVPCQEVKVLRPSRRYGRPMLLKDIVEDVMADLQARCKERQV